MTGKLIGYKRVSTHEQNPDSQLMGIALDKVFVEIESGFSVKNRVQLANLKDYVREDDIVYVECMDRLGRNGYDLDEIVEFLLAKGVQINFVREGIILGKKNDLMSKLSYDIMKAFIHFYSELSKERMRRGIKQAQLDGKYKGGKPKLDALQVEILKLKLNTTRDSITDISKELGVSRTTVYRYIAKIQEKEKNNGNTSSDIRDGSPILMGQV